MINDIEHFVYILTGHFLLFVVKLSGQISCPFFELVGVLLFVHRSSLFWVQSLSGVCIANTFSLSLTCFCLFLMVSLEKHKFLILTKSSLPSFSFVIHVFCVLYNSFLPTVSLQRYFPVFSSRSFIVLALTGKSVIQGELLFVDGVK